MDDKQIIKLFFERSEQAIKRTDEKYGKLGLMLANRILGNFEDSKECVNDAYLCLWNKIPPEKPAHLAAYFCKTVRLLSLKKLEFTKAEKRSAALSMSFDELESVLPDGRADPAELGSLISDFLRGEKPVSRNVFLRKYLFFDTVEEIAARFGMKESTVKSTLFRTRNRLREYLKKEGIDA